MDFSFSEEQQLLKDSVDRFIRDAYSFEQRKSYAQENQGFSPAIWQQMAELGWLGVALPEEYGGFGGGTVETMLIMEAIGHGLVLEPYFPSVVLGGRLLQSAGTDAQKQALLPSLAAGELKLAFAFAERQARFDLFDVQSRAEAANDGFLLNGHKAVVLGGPSADHFIVSARSAGGQRDRQGIGLFLVDRTAKGLKRRDYATVDGLQASELIFEDVIVDQGNILGSPLHGLAAIDEAADHGIAALSAEAVGCMQVLLDATNEYLKTRKQFGAPLSKFQVLQHRMVDMFMAVEQARSMSYLATLKLHEQADERRKIMSAVKVQIGKSAKFVGEQAIQLHGGMGMTDELNVGHYFKRLTMIEILFGNQDYHLKNFAALN